MPTATDPRRASGRGGTGPRDLWILDDGLVMGGGQRFALRLAAVCFEAGVHVHFVAPARSALGEAALAQGLELSDVTYPRLVPPALWAIPGTIARLRAVLADVPADALIVGNTARCQAYATAAFLALPHPRPHLVHLMHEQDSAQRRTARAVYRRIGALVAVGDNAGRAYRRRLPQVPVAVVNNFVSRADMERMRSTHAAPPAGDRPVVGVLGRMIAEKGVLELVEELAAIGGAWSELRVAAPFQSGRYTEQVRRRIAELGLEQRVHLLGEVDDVDGFFAGIDVLVVPSTGNEGQPTVIIEGLLHGRPVVVREGLWSVDYEGLPMRSYVDPDDLARALGAPAPEPVPLDVLDQRFGAPQVLSILQGAGVAGPHGPRRPSYQDWHGEPGYWRDVTRHFPREARLLDIGCGTAWLGDHFPDYVGIDDSEEAIAVARGFGRHALRHTVDEPLPFADESFDGVVLKDLLEHVNDPVGVVREVLRVLRPGGRVFASSPDAQRWAWDDYTHRRPFTRKSYRLLFADQGFVIERVAWESVMPGIGLVASFTRRHRRPRSLAWLAWLPITRRNVWVLARRPGGAPDEESKPAAATDARWRTRQRDGSQPV